jgi:hypothetical protein
MRAAHLAGAAVGLLTLLSGPVALAQTDDGSNGMTIFGLSVSARVSASASPDYLGSNDYKVGPTVSFSFHRLGHQHTFPRP